MKHESDVKREVKLDRKQITQLCSLVTSCFIQWTLSLWTNLRGDVSSPWSIRHRLALAFWSKCTDGEIRFLHGKWDRDGLWIGKAETGRWCGGCRYVPLHICCQQRDGLVSFLFWVTDTTRKLCTSPLWWIPTNDWAPFQTGEPVLWFCKLVT